MTLNLRIECLPEPTLLFGANESGVEPRRIMAKHGAADKTGGLKDLRIGIVGPPSDVQLARRWLPRLNTVAIAREKSARRYRDWPGAQRVLGVKFVIDEKFVRPLDDNRLNLAFQRSSPSERFDELLDLFDAKIQGLFGDMRPDCIVVCLPDDLADMRISNPRLSAKEREILEQLQREEEQEQMSLFQPTPEELKAAEELRTTAEDLLFRTFYRALKEPWRGTLCTVGEESYLFTMGYVAWWDEYPGPHIPAPLEIGSCGHTDIRERARELLALTKMNWNSTEGMGRYPITISFARKVGMLMTELSENQIPNPSYRFYM